MEEMTQEQFLQRARELRAAVGLAEGALLDFLYSAEQVPRLWNSGHGLTFPEFIERQDICKAIRYLHYKSVRDGLGAEAVTGVSPNAIDAAASLKSSPQQREVLARARAWEESNGTAISLQTAQRLARETRMVEFGRRQPKGYEQLAREVKRLEAENERLRAEIVALKAQLKKDKGKRKRSAA